jgi:pyruvate kinase
MTNQPARRTKIIATLGPATDTPELMEQIITAGADVFRLNFSHGASNEQRDRVKMLREASSRVGKHVGILGDLQGPKIRIRRFKNGSVILKEGQLFNFDTALDGDSGDETVVGVAYEALPNDVRPGDVLLLDDGHLSMVVKEVSGSRINCCVEVGGELSNHKGINLHGGGLSAPALTDKDREDILLAAELEVDWLAVSFVSKAEDIDEARELLRNAGGTAHLVAKIERSEAVKNLESIIDASDAVMVARGDLGVEVGYAALTSLQKRIIKTTRQRHKVVITATQMMESMIHNQIPTRAEVSDVANAVMDGTDAVMLSAESAVGEFPIKAVASMAEICLGAEAHDLVSGRRKRHEEHFDTIDEAVAMAVMYTTAHMDVDAIVALTESGDTARWMSRIRSDIPIFAFTRHKQTRRRVTLYRGVYPISFDVTHTDNDRLHQDLFNKLLDLQQVNAGDLLVFTQGDLTGIAGGTNSMKILRVTSQ